MNLCVLIPTYNNAGTLADVVDRALAVCPHVLVVNDGSTDGSAQLLQRYADDGRIALVSYEHNRGKGHALRLGLQQARDKGYDFAITLDSDGQHFPEDIPAMVSVLEQQPDDRVMLVGSRNLSADGMPKQNSFANRFSNFWFRLQTGLRLPDTQTGFRAYPLHHLPCLALLTRRYESELELLVFSAWRGVRMVPVPVQVYYPPQGERVTHFRPFADFARISLLNTLLCFAALLYGHPRRLLSKLIQ